MIVQMATPEHDFLGNFIVCVVWLCISRKTFQMIYHKRHCQLALKISTTYGTCGGDNCADENWLKGFAIF
jgi:hypothetical protein